MPVQRDIDIFWGRMAIVIIVVFSRELLVLPLEVVLLVEKIPTALPSTSKRRFLARIPRPMTPSDYPR